MPTCIELTTAELQAAEAEAHRRQSHNEAKRLKGRNNAPASGQKALQMHRLGCVGELAVAKLLGLDRHLFKHETAMRGSTDLPGGIEVKTRSNHRYDLLVQLDDDPNKVFVLATHEGGETAHVVGWINGRDAMRKEWIREFVRGRPCYAVPQSALRPIEQLEVDVAPVSRVLGSHEAWLTEQAGPSGETEVILNFSEELADSLGWTPGDTLEWDIIRESSQCVIRKINERTQDVPNDDQPGLAGA